MRFFAFSRAAALSAAVLPSFAQDLSAPGYSLTPAPFPGTAPLAASTTLSSGDFLVFDGTDVVHHAPDGAVIATLASFASSVFPSFLVPDADESSAYLGESTNGGVYRVALGASGALEQLAVLPFNYDGAPFEDHLYVSAATCGFFCGNEVWRIDLLTGATTLVAEVSGASGPLVLSAAGDLYYASVSDSFPPPPGHATVWRWSRAQLLGPQVLDLTDATRIGLGFEGAARLAWDRRDAVLYLAETNFVTGENRLRRVLGDAGQSPVLVEGRPFFSAGSLSFHPSLGPARFRAFQPEAGGTLTYTTTDFFAAPERLQVRPLRPLASLTTPAPGQLELGLVSGPPHGFARILVGPRAALPASERAFLLAGLPIFFGLERSSQAVAPGLVPLDALGGLQQVTPDPGGAGGALAVQVLLFDAQLRPAGTSSVAVL